MSHTTDNLWQAIRDEVTTAAASEPMLASFLHMTVLRHKSFDDVLAFHLSSKLASATMDARALMELISEALQADPLIAAAARADIQAVRDRDPACKAFSTPLLFFKGYQALQCYRVAHWLWREGREALALHLQNRISEVFAVDIHPAARIGKGILLDHGTGFVVGETVVIDDNVSILQEVTLGGTGKESGDRHPKIRTGVLIGAGAKILGNIEIGTGAKVGAGSVVLEPVPPHVTVVGVPAHIVGNCDEAQPAQAMDHRIIEDQ
ncbi:serine O-acetyltransferase [Leeia oryzae]|uniref:serine O-acetyltransferase n=1 Tax=Leeia oryzae TaxID=356662 RepID=UPI00035CF10C|nr:serine O-acetyltransferase [Leeia oryzae]